MDVAQSQPIVVSSRLGFRLTRLPKIMAFVVLVTVCRAVPALAADKLDLRFEMFGFAGLHLLTNRTVTEETPKTYAIATNIRSRGVVSAFVDVQLHSEVYGTIAADMLHPDTYRSEMTRNGVTRDFGVKYMGDGSVINMVAPPPPEGAYLDGVPLRGRVDQLTAYYLVERQLNRGGTCDLVIPVFDGSELYTLRFTSIGGETTLAADHYQNFSGPVHTCEVTRDVTVANPNKLMGTYNKGRLWYARLLPGGKVVAVRAEYDSVVGSIDGYLGELTAPGVHLKFMDE
jgi:hypothetical protein